MPTYAFRCSACGHEFEVQTSWSAKGEVVCPACGARELKELFGRYRLVSAGGSGNGSGGSGAAFRSGFT
ncbi:MAG: zinc ribbon domain-containing protein [Bacillota bacterium]|nr:hypothetical protein [Bacillota bacterium]REJ36651.1 MAG: hypothetical protein DIU82_03655 [Bacillota bacterium]